MYYWYCCDSWQWLLWTLLLAIMIVTSVITITSILTTTTTLTINNNDSINIDINNDLLSLWYDIYIIMRSILIITVVMVVVILIAIVIATIEIPMKSPGAHLLRGPWDWCLACRGTDQERRFLGIQNPGRTLLFCVFGWYDDRITLLSSVIICYLYIQLWFLNVRLTCCLHDFPVCQLAGQC